MWDSWAMRSDSCTNDNEKPRLQTEEEKDKQHLLWDLGFILFYRMLLEISGIFLTIFRFRYVFTLCFYFVLAYIYDKRVCSHQSLKGPCSADIIATDIFPRHLSTENTSVRTSFLSRLPSIHPSIFPHFNRHRPVILTYRLAWPYSFTSRLVVLPIDWSAVESMDFCGSVMCRIDGWPVGLRSLSTPDLSISLYLSFTHTPLTCLHSSIGWRSMSIVIMERRRGLGRVREFGLMIWWEGLDGCDLSVNLEEFGLELFSYFIHFFFTGYTLYIFNLLGLVRFLNVLEWSLLCSPRIQDSRFLFVTYTII